MRMSLQFDEIFNKNFKILISRNFDIFTKSFPFRTGWETL